uniref:Uncharacterized protein n=1 Tax=Arundo donax TaxID=35708 RepID=A0A0A9TFX6_ARUDO
MHPDSAYMLTIAFPTTFTGARPNFMQWAWICLPES